MKVSSKLKEKILDILNSKNYNICELDNFLNEYFDNGNPKKELIFLDFSNIPNIIDKFFRNYGLHYFNKDLFINTPKKSSKKYKEKLSIQEKELVDKIICFKEKMTKIYEDIRDNFGKILQEENQIFICPYCQRNYIGIFDNKDAIKGYTTPDLDHFYPKSKYPFLAATISNLIPACSVCNQRIKKDKDIYEKNIPNPLEENIFEKIEFDFNYIEFNNDKLPYIKSIYISNIEKLDDNYKKYIKFFKIQEQYSLHSEIPKNIKRKFDKYNIVKKNHLKKCCSSLNDKIIEDMVFQEYKYIDKKTTPLWKLKQDIYKKMKNETT